MTADMISRLTSTSINKYDPITMKDQCCKNKLFTISRSEKKRRLFPTKYLKCANRTTKEN